MKSLKAVHRNGGRNAGYSLPGYVESAWCSRATLYLSRSTHAIVIADSTERGTMTLDPTGHQIFRVTANSARLRHTARQPQPRPAILPDRLVGLVVGLVGECHITGGTLIPITANTRVKSRRTTATVASRNFFRPSSASLRMGWRW
jgi:hypothetical protein